MSPLLCSEIAVATAYGALLFLYSSTALRKGGNRMQEHARAAVRKAKKKASEQLEAVMMLMILREGGKRWSG